MRAIRLVAFVDEYDTTPGFIIKGTAHFEGLMADRGGEMIAHDIVEHQNGLDPMGNVWDELEALGGIWQVRGRWGSMLRDRDYHSPVTHMSSDLVRMFSEWDGELGPHSMATRPHVFDEDFAEIIAKAREDIPKEDPEADPDEIERFLALALHRMRTGFRKAERRFGSNAYGSELFVAIREAVKDAHREVEYEGQEFVLIYGNGTATVREDREHLRD